MPTTLDKIQLGGNIRRVITSANKNFSKLVFPQGTIVKGNIGGLNTGTDISNYTVTDVLSAIINGSDNSAEIVSAEMNVVNGKLSAPNTYSIPFNANTNVINNITITTVNDLSDGKAPKSAVVTVINGDTGAELGKEEVAEASLTFPTADNKKTLKIDTNTITVAGNVYSTPNKAVLVKVAVTLADNSILEYNFSIVAVAYAYYGAIDYVDASNIGKDGGMTAEDFLKAVKGATATYDTAVDNVIEKIHYTSTANKSFFIASSTEFSAINTAYGVLADSQFTKIETADAAYKYVYVLTGKLGVAGVDVFFDASFEADDAGKGNVANTFVTFKNVWYTGQGPLDAKMVAANMDAVNALKSVAYKGMIIYNQADDKRYVFNGTDFVALRAFPLASDKTIGNASEITFRDNNVETALENLLYTKIYIAGFGNSVNNAENGQTITDVTLNWWFNDSDPIKPAVVKSITLSDGANIPLEKTDRSKKLTGKKYTSTTTFTLTVTDNRDATDTKKSLIVFYDKAYWGKVKDKSDAGITNDVILKLEGSTLTNNRGRDFTVTAGAGEYIVYAIPKTFGTPVFYVGGFEGGFDKIKEFDFTNASGYTTSYDVYASTQANLGETTVSVK